MLHTQNSSSRNYFLLILAILGLALALRVASFGWNTRLQGDVNLFALTAREMATHHRLYYPMKYEYSDHVEYLTLANPATQHPPLYPFLAGVLGWVFDTDDTFFLLKLLTELTALLLFAVIVLTGLRQKRPMETALALLFIAISPMLVDFSANGSVYIGMATVLVLATILLANFRYQGWRDYVLAGLLCGLGLQIHNTLSFLPVLFGLVWLSEYRRRPWKGLVVFGLTAGLVLSPWMLWNLHHFGRPFYSYSPLFLLMQWGLAQEGVFGDIVTARSTGSADLAFWARQIGPVLQILPLFLFSYLLEVGPFCLLLALVGGMSALRRNLRRGIILILPTLICLIMPNLTAIFRGRYVAPLLPMTYVTTAFGFTWLWRNPSRRRLALIGLFGTILWVLPQYFQTPPTRYYVQDRGHAKYYTTMKELAQDLSQREPGVVLGYARGLDGGIEGIYWHQLPFVRGRGNGPPHEDYPGQKLQKLAADFHVRYIWADDSTLAELQRVFPHGQIVLQSFPFYVLELPR